MLSPRHLRLEQAGGKPAGVPDSGRLLAVRPVGERHRAEVLAFLSAGTVDTIYMSGLIRDNGLQSPENRGTFYGAFGEAGELEGVALIGHFVLVEARSEQALSSLAATARMNPSAHMIVGAPEKIDLFWHHYADGGREPRLICRELFFARRRAAAEEGDAQPLRGLRLATPADLDLIVPVQALLAYDESGVNPLARDAAGFRRRVARRVEMGRVWVVTEAGHLVAKVDVMADTPEAVYLESLYVRPEDRGAGYGLRCLSQVTRELLRRTPCVCFVVNEQNKAAQSLALRAGFKLRGLYDSIYLAPHRLAKN